MQGQKEVIEQVNSELEMDETIPLHKKGWLLQKVGWALILLVMLAGLLGIFGDGWLSKRSITSGFVTASFERFYRYEAEMKIALQANQHMGTISLPQQYVKHFRIVRFEPLPVNNHSEGGDIVYSFNPGNNRIVTIYLIPMEYGAINGTMKINGANSIQLDHFIFP